MINKSKIKRILVINLTNIGDCILTLPVLSVLRSEMPEAKLDMICGKVPVALFQGSDDIDQLYVYDKRWSYWQKWKWILEIRRTQYDLIVDLRHTMIPVLVPSKYKTRMLRTKNKSGGSVREKHLSVIKHFGFDIGFTKPFPLYGDLELKEVDKRFSDLGNDYAVVVPGANASMKRWPEESFKQVIHYLINEKKLKVVLLGSENEKEFIDPMVESCSSGVDIVNAVGKTSLREAAAILSKACVVVSNDSAIMQMAQEMDVKTVSIFGPTNPWKYSKQGENIRIVRKDLECSPCELPICKLDRRKCLDDLSAEEVEKEIEQLLAFSF